MGLRNCATRRRLDGDPDRANFRGTYFHVPLMVIGVVIASLPRTPGFHWLALLIVIAELAIVFLRFTLSYEQACMGDHDPWHGSEDVNHQLAGAEL